MTLTKTDINRIKKAVEKKLDERLDVKITGVEKRLSVKIARVGKRLNLKMAGVEGRLDERITDVEERLNEKLRLLPSKDEFFQKMDEVMGELETIREEQTIIGQQTTDHEERITTLEKNQLPNPPTA